jgi:hypothetical protein
MTRCPLISYTSDAYMGNGGCELLAVSCKRLAPEFLDVIGDGDWWLVVGLEVLTKVRRPYHSLFRPPSFFDCEACTVHDPAEYILQWIYNLVTHLYHVICILLHSE